MAKVETAPIPDAYGHTIFCDDVRFEIDGKVTYVGAYNAFLFIQGEFPFTLPKFCFGIFFYQKEKIYRRDIGVRVFLPGDADDKASLEANIQSPSDREIPRVEPIKGEEPGGYTVMGTHLMLAPFVIPEPGLIKVRILRDGVLHRIGTLKVRQHPVSASSAAPLPS
jgi:hypothetical protein